MPIDYKKYPKDWSEIRKRILDRARNRCEQCGLQNGVTGYRDSSGKFHASEGMQVETDLLDGERVFRIVLTIAHLNHDIHDNRPENLMALCQRCHLSHDKDHHRATRWKNQHATIPELGL